jgi:uncharacterized iron-regulated membrane protein
MKKIVKQLHRWLSLSSAVVLFVVCLSGTVFVYADEIMALIHKPYATVPVIETQRLSVEELRDSIKKRFPSYNVGNVVIFKNPHNAYKFLIFNKKDGIQTVFVNPFNAEILGFSKAHNFFYLIAHLHSELLLGAVGAWIVKIGTMLFLIILITGFLLWKPKKLTSSNYKNFFTLKRSKTFRSRAFNHHRILGFYALLMLLMLTLTGTIMAFDPLQNLVVKAFSRSESKRNEMAYNLQTTPEKFVSIDHILKPLLDQPDVRLVKVGLMRREKDDPYMVLSGDKIDILTYNGLMRQYDCHSGLEIQNPAIKSQSNAENLILKLHLGQWGGWLSKLLTFISGLIASYLIVTGVVIWWNKRRV